MLVLQFLLLVTPPLAQRLPVASAESLNTSATVKVDESGNLLVESAPNQRVFVDGRDVLAEVEELKEQMQALLQSLEPESVGTTTPATATATTASTSTTTDLPWTQTCTCRNECVCACGYNWPGRNGCCFYELGDYDSCCHKTEGPDCGAADALGPPVFNDETSRTIRPATDKCHYTC